MTPATTQLDDLGLARTLAWFVHLMQLAANGKPLSDAEKNTLANMPESIATFLADFLAERAAKHAPPVSVASGRGQCHEQFSSPAKGHFENFSNSPVEPAPPAPGFTRVYADVANNPDYDTFEVTAVASDRPGGGQTYALFSHRRGFLQEASWPRVLATLRKILGDPLPAHEDRSIPEETVRVPARIFAPPRPEIIRRPPRHKR